MKIHYQLTFDDLMVLQTNFFQTNEYHQKRAKLGSILLVLFTYLTSSSLLLEILPGNISSNLVIPVSVGGGIVVAILLAPFLRNLYVKIQVWRYKKAYSQLKQRDWPRDYTTILDEEGIELHVNNSKVIGKTKYAWTAFHKGFQDEQRFFLYYTDTDAVILPKQGSLMSEEDQEELKKFVNQHIGHLFKLGSN